MAYDLTLYYYLKKNVRICYKTTTGDETMIRCPFCGDSKKDPSKARFYIHNKAPFKFICFNCGTTGAVNDKVLSMIINDSSTYEISSYIKQKNQENKTSSFISGSKETSKFYKKYFSKELDFSVNDKNQLKKLDYLSNRLGIIFTEEDISKYKLVLDIEDFFNKNNLSINKRFQSKKDKFVLDDIKKNYIGFLSSDRTTIIFRNTDVNEKTYRFKNFRIFLDEDMIEKKTYNISKTIDIYKEKYTIVITEGPMDILGVYNHIYKEKEDLENYIFLANGGKSFINTMEFITKLSLLNVDIIIYSDKDVGIDFYKKLKETNPIFKNNNVYIYYNLKEKDFGVKKEDIKLSSRITI